MDGQWDVHPHAHVHTHTHVCSPTCAHTHAHVRVHNEANSPFFAILRTCLHTHILPLCQDWLSLGRYAGYDPLVLDMLFHLQIFPSL
jgi:hypothetical protein